MTFLQLAWPPGRVAPSEGARGVRQYLRDPNGVLAELSAPGGFGRAALPADARDTGYRHGAYHLWVSRSSLHLTVVSIRDLSGSGRSTACRRGCAALVEQSIGHLANAWALRRWRGLLYRLRDVFRATGAMVCLGCWLHRVPT